MIFTSQSIASAGNEIYSERRDKVMTQLEGGVAILQNTPVYARNSDVDYVYRTNSDFYYLTGCDLPQAVMVLIPESKTPFVLFIDPPSAMADIWGTGNYTLSAARAAFSADTVYDLADMENKLSGLIRGKEEVLYDFKSEAMHELIQRVSTARWGPRPDTFRDLLPLIHEMRKVKSAAEIELMRHAINTTCAGLNESMKAVEPEMYEYEVQAVLEYVFRIKDCPFNGFPPIVASGPNATIMHYEKNKRQMKDGELLLMDVGAEYNYYGADITRTFPVNGKFTKEQAEIYQLVLDAQTAALDSMIPGVPAYHCHKAADKIIRDGLFRLGLITDPNTTWQHLLYYYPWINHSLGMDVHDAGNFGGRSRSGGYPLEAGVVMTNEPALYFGERWIESFRRAMPRRHQIEPDSIEAFLEQIMPVYQNYMDIGIRIEDDVLITPDGNEVLSKDTPRQIDEIEALMSEKSHFKW